MQKFEIFFGIKSGFIILKIHLRTILRSVTIYLFVWQMVILNAGPEKNQRLHTIICAIDYGSKRLLYKLCHT